MHRVYFLTSSHYNPAGIDFAPLCLVWIGDSKNHTITSGRVYRSYNLPKMLNLANMIAQEKNLPLTVLSIDPTVVEVYSRDRAPP